MSHHILELIDTNPNSLGSFPERIIINPKAITCISLKDDKVICNTNCGSEFVFTRQDSEIATILYNDLMQKMINVHRFEQDGQKSDAYENYIKD